MREPIVSQDTAGNRPRFQGIIPPLVTPLTDRDTLDEAGALALDQLQVPPFLIDDPTTPGALRSSPVYAVPLAGGPLVLLVNVFEGTAEVVEARDW